MANYTLNFDNAYADCLNVTLINFKLMQIVLSFSNAIFNFDSYGVSIGFGGNNSKTSVSSIAWFILMILLLQILKHFLLLLQLLILKLLVTLLLGFISIVRVYVWEPPYTTAPPCNAWGNAPVDDS